MMQPFAEWGPDAYQTNADLVSEALGVLCGPNGYRPFPQPAVTSLAVGASTVTITIASPAVITWNAHGLLADDTVIFSTTGALPTGLTAGTTYFVLAAGLAANTFRVSTSSGGAAVNTSGSQSGTHTATYTDTVVRGAFAARTSGNAISIFAATAKKIYKFAGVSTVWTNFSRAATNYALGADEYWSSCQFGDNLIFAEGADAVQVVGVDAGTQFAALGGSPPNSRYARVIGDYVFLAATATSRRAIKNSGLNASDWWTADQKSSSGQTFPDGGDATGLVGFEQGGLIFQTETVRRLDLVTDARIYVPHRIDAARGTSSPYSIVTDGADVYYWADTGFMKLGADGSIVNIGEDKVNDWFAGSGADWNKARPKAIVGALDPIVRRIFWLYPRASNASSTTLDGLIVYDIVRNRWTHATCALTYIFRAAVPGVTLAGLAALYSTLTAVPYPFGSDVWKGGAPGLAAFDSANKLCFFTGTPMAASVQTSPFEPIPGKRAHINGCRLYGDATTATGMVGGAERPQTAILFDGAQSLNAQGRIPARKSTRIAQVQIDIPAGTAWRDLAGIDFEDGDIRPDGKR